MTRSYQSNIWKYYLLKIFSAAELTISIFVLFLLANNLSMTKVMILEAIFIVTVLVLEVPSGVFADIFGRKKSLLIAMFCASLSFLVFGIGAGFYAFLVAQVILAVNFAFTSGADSALLYDSLKVLKREKEYPKFYGRANFLSLITWAISALVSGFLAIHLGYRGLFFLTTILFALGFFVTLFFAEPPISQKLIQKKYLLHLMGAIKFSYKHKIIRNIILYIAIFGSVGNLTWFLIQPFYQQSNLPGYIVGFAVFLLYMSKGVGSLTAEKFIRKIKEGKLLLLTLFVASLCFLGMFFVSKLISLFLITIMSFASGLRDVTVNKEVNKYTDSYRRATVISIMNVPKGLIYALLAPIIGYFTDIFTPAAAFLMIGFCLFLFLLYYLVPSWISKKSPAF
jgi:MFS family permease